MKVKSFEIDTIAKVSDANNETARGERERESMNNAPRMQVN